MLVPLQGGVWFHHAVVLPGGPHKDLPAGHQGALADEIWVSCASRDQESKLNREHHYPSLSDQGMTAYPHPMHAS